MKKVLLILLILVLSLSFVACGKDKATNPVVNDAIVYNFPTEPMVKSMPDTNIDFVKDGKSDYIVVAPSGASTSLITVIKDLVNFIQEATGAKLPMLYDNEVTYSSDKKFIVVGCDNINELAGIESDILDLQERGYAIYQKDNSVFIQANHVYGLQNGVYGFLEYQIKFRTYTKSVTKYIISNNLKLKAFNIKEKPEFRFPTLGTITTSTSARRMKMDGLWTNYITVGGAILHNSLGCLPKGTYQETHSSWYSTSGQQLCYTAHGNEDELNLMIDKASEVILQGVAESSDGCTVTFTMMDSQLACDCDACVEKTNLYGTPTAAVIQFTNKLAEKVNKALESEGREVDIVFFAYQDATRPPVVLNNGKYEPIDDSILLGEHVGVLYAPMYATYTDSFYEKSNAYFDEEVKQWEVLTNNFYLFLYQTYYFEYLLPFNSFYSSIETMKYFDEKDIVSCYYSLGQESVPSTSFNDLKNYLESRYMWDLTLDYDTVVKEYFWALYGDAAEPMYKYFMDLTSYFEIQEKKHENIKDVWGEITNPEIWDYAVIKRWESYINDAYNKIAYLEEFNPETYKLYHDNIEIEHIAIKYELVTFCDAYFCAEDLLNLKLSFKESAERVGINRFKEGATLSGLYSQWGI